MEHPRPTLTRPDWASLDGTWEFGLGRPVDSPADFVFDRHIEVPFAPESDASGLGLARAAEPRYRRTFDAAPGPAERVLLHLEGVDHHARVWVDGHAVGEHEGGYVPFTLDVTDALAPGHSHELVVAASDDPNDLTVPRGKQSWTEEPAVIWYRRSSGIWRSVWVEVVPAQHIASVAWTTRNLADASLTGVVRLAGVPRGSTGLELVATFRTKGRLLARRILPVAGPRVDLTAVLAPGRGDTGLWWSPRTPVLIDIDLELRRDGRVVDAAASYTGIRIVDTADGMVRINGDPTFLRMVLEQGYWPHTGFTAPSAEDARAEARLIRALGFNGLRMHQVSADPRFLRACDELGLLVWADLPAALVFSPAMVARQTRTLTGLVERDHNHPSVIAWVPFNESWGVPDVAHDPQQQDAVRALHHLARALDPTRLALGNDGWEAVTGDVVGVHDYSHNPRALLRRYGRRALPLTLTWWRSGGHALLVGPVAARAATARWLTSSGTPVVLSEFGGVSLDADADAWEGYGGVACPDALVERVAALCAAVGKDSGLAGFCWTQLTDTMQEQNGLAWPDRTPKAPAAALAGAIRGTG